jgi:transposase-like protein
VPEIDTAHEAVPASEQAGDRTRETRSFMRSVRRATRRKYTPEEKIRIVLEGFRREATVSDPCRREGINPANYYLLDQRVHGGREGEADTQHFARCHPAKRSSSSSVRTVT